MEINKPKKVKGGIERIVVPERFANMVGFTSRGISEAAGFLYGVKKKKDVYVGSLSYKLDLWKGGVVNPTNVSFEMEGSEDYIRAHNRICKLGKRNFPGFVQLSYHSHPKLAFRDLDDESRVELRENYPAECDLYGIEDLVQFLDNGVLSPEDLEFASKYSSGGVLALAVGREGDDRVGPMKGFVRRLFQKVRSEPFGIGGDYSRLRGFGVLGEDSYEIPVVVAERTGDLRDRDVCCKTIDSMDSLKDVSMDYALNAMRKFSLTNPRWFNTAMKLFSSAPEYEAVKRKISR